MTALDRVKAKVRAWFGPVSSSDPAILDLFGVKPVTAGVSVSEDAALGYTAVWACVQLISGTLGSLPLFLYRRLKPAGKERMVENRLYRLLHDSPNDEMSSATFRETIQAHILLWGNGFAEIVRDGSGRVAALWPIEPWRVSLERDRRSGFALRYRVHNLNSNTDTILRPDQILHIPGLSGDGVLGWSVIRKAREAVGLGLATEKFGAAFFGQGATFGGVLQHPGRLSDAARTHLENSIKSRHQGVDRAHQFVILEEGLRYERIGIPPEDAQFLETRRFQLSEVARMFGCPPHMIGDVERSTSWGTGIEHQNIAFVTYTMRRWFVRWEQELTRKLIAPSEMNQQLIEFLVDGLLRGDTAARYNAYNIGRNGGWFSANDIRELENMNPIEEGGNIYLVPANMVPADQAGLPRAPAPAPAAPEPAPGGGRELFREALAGVEADLRTLLAREAPVPLDPAEALREDLEAIVGRVAAVHRTLEELGVQLAPPDLAPLEARLDAADADLRTLLAREPALPMDPRPELAEVRERLVVLQDGVVRPVHLDPVMARLEAAEADMRTLLAREPTLPRDLEPDLTELRGRLEALQAAVESLPAALPPPNDLGPILARLDADEADRKEVRGRLGALLPIILAWVEQEARDFVRREADRARRAATTVDKLQAWAAEFYPRQADYAVKALGHAMAAYTTLVGRATSEAELRELVAGYVTESTEALAGLIATPPEDVRAAVDALVSRWETERPAALAAALLKEVVTDAKC